MVLFSFASLLWKFLSYSQTNCRLSETSSFCSVFRTRTTHETCWTKIQTCGSLFYL
jgi:hypothetical protein